MKRKFDIEVAVGIFLVIGFLSVAYLSLKFGNFQLIGERGYVLSADFSSVGGLKSGAPVEIAGVDVGRVKSITLDPATYRAKVALQIKPAVKVQEDAIASIKTKGLLGEKYVKLAPGASEVFLQQGGKVRETESSVDLEEMLSKYAFGEVK